MYRAEHTEENKGAQSTRKVSTPSQLVGFRYAKLRGCLTALKVYLQKRKAQNQDSRGSSQSIRKIMENQNQIKWKGENDNKNKSIN